VVNSGAYNHKTPGVQSPQHSLNHGIAYALLHPALCSKPMQSKRHSSARHVLLSAADDLLITGNCTMHVRGPGRRPL
jgi:hypothetical protein